MSHKAAMLGAAASLALIASGAEVANAAHFNGWYLGVEGGANWIQDVDAAFRSGLTGGPPTTTIGQNYELNSGWAAFATLGFGFFSHWRVELEGGYRHNKIDRVHWTSGANTSPSGNLNEWSIMANVAYDFMITDRWGLSLGAGFGADNAEFRLVTQPAGTARADDGDWGFAFQGIAGLTYAISDRSDVVLNYRYMRVDSPSWGGTASGPNFIRVDAEDLGKHTVTIGLRYDLWPDYVDPGMGPPPPPPPPPPTPEMAQSFMIFFGFNKCNITAEADRVLGQAAEAARASGNAIVQIVGHTDTMGTQAYNQKLSVCRAHAAKSNMVSKGIPADAIATSGRGETELLVQTADNVKEPQNRRATIDMP